MERGGFPGGTVVKNPLARARDTGSILGREDLLESEMATHSSILTGKICMDTGAWQATFQGVAKHGKE